jgi:hypothetical protein
MKVCAQCNEAKPLASFYQQPNSADGHDCSFKLCRCFRAKVRRLTDPSVQQRDRERAKTPQRRQHARSNADRWRKENPTGYRAHNAVSNAIRYGKMIKGPCALCGAAENVHGHHKDYTQPLKVVWLCAKCHHRVHATFPELGANAHEKERL